MSVPGSVLETVVDSRRYPKLVNVFFCQIVGQVARKVTVRSSETLIPANNVGEDR